MSSNWQKLQSKIKTATPKTNTDTNNKVKIPISNLLLIMPKTLINLHPLKPII